jgi:streptogramin lyase
VREVTLPTGQFDGIVVMPDGKLLVASQLGHNVYRVDLATGAATAVAENIEIPAAIGLDTRRMRLLVPQIRAGSLSIYELARTP